MSGTPSRGAVEIGIGRLPAKDADHNHTNETQSPRPIPISWLEGKKNWPDHAERKLEDFMVKNTFFNYRSTKDESCQKMDRILQELQSLFDTTDWDKQVHLEKLKEKVCNKIHRIRARRDALAEFRNVLRRLPPEAHEEAVRAMVEAVGKERVSAGLAEMEEMNWLDFDTFGEA